MSKISPKDYITWGIAVFAIMITFIQGHKIRQLEIRQSIIHNSIQNVLQYTVNNNYNLPPPVQAEIKNIAKESGVHYVTYDGHPVTYNGQPVIIK